LIVEPNLPLAAWYVNQIVSPYGGGSRGNGARSSPSLLSHERICLNPAAPGGVALQILPRSGRGTAGTAVEGERGRVAPVSP